MAGAEKLIHEIVSFSKNKGLQPTVLIANNYSIEYYDAVFGELGVPVVRTTLNGIRKLRNPVNIAKALYWRIKLKYFANNSFKSVQVIGLYNVAKVFNTVDHGTRFFWHVENAVQHIKGKYPYPGSLFSKADDTIVYINQYQIEELAQQYGDTMKCRRLPFKLFLVQA